MIGGLAALLLCQLAGEALARALHLPVPGPVLGMAILLLVLLARGAVPDGVAGAADGLLGHLGLLFVPAGVGVVLHLDLLAAEAWPIGLAVIGGTLLVLGVTGLIAQRLLARP